ncbi:hypothetical protein FGRMN_10464 [Fusarium graminum]|nr:hypothetical protein FGRMN_10464 [Fusarium graminum]
MEPNDMSMQGEGYYNANCTLQSLAIDNALSLLEPPEVNGTSITLADYGSSEGKNAIQLMAHYLANLPGLRSATLVFEDTPFNDFSSLATTIDTNWELLSQNGKLSISTLMAPKSFFEQVLPDNFVDAGYCFTALHWLQHMPSSSEYPCMKDLAHKDLVSFLSARYKEIRPRGALTLCIPCHGPIEIVANMECLQTALRSLASTYHVDPSFKLRLPYYIRTMEEILFSVKTEKERWVLGYHATIPIVHPSWSPTVLDQDNIDLQAREAYADGIAGFTLAACSRFLMDDTGAYPKKRDLHGSALHSADLRETSFLEDLTACFKNEFLRSYITEEVGLTYALVQLQRLP